MLAFIVTALFSGAVYLLLTAGSGSVLHFWAPTELVVACFVALAVGLVARKYFAHARQRAVLNPVRWVLGVAYAVGPFFLEMAKANVDVAYRVITGRIRPGIMRVKSGMKTDVGTLMLANSITLTPGTLTVDIDEETNDLYVHFINLADETKAREFLEAEEVFGLFNCPAWVRRIAE
ncbi:MAG TPA: Na+/H+ antiporter subunit E [Kiritimatiellia bacterium]|jgi:multicomponent Na+:H+ antiporter subunit E|nr:Na+/H+ antiporter subunit E [Kiritimatiellia bacterium]OQC59304.1 MAG: Na(+)/H(+) antiporter subunit E [Verrucomicrobia bacterium ADurb.Bin018]MBP9572851.1 Na+/H+ antiporter subunit E [Kiritimatiellia bacterium]HOE00667.1 Na+/H+ antiporter subunit E [Kiritimatiellia bacterium]HOE36250.1 Na+/H+ antiporter subunit E [Kiritimatiellia bacterium]